MQQVIQNLKPMLSELIGLIITAVVISIARIVSNLLKQNLSQRAYEDLSKIVLTCVRSAQQTLVIPAKDPSRPEVQWDAETAESVKRQVRALVKVAGVGAIQSLKDSGMADGAILTLIDQLIESHVLAEKNSDTASTITGVINKVAEMATRLPGQTNPPKPPAESSNN